MSKLKNGLLKFLTLILGKIHVGDVGALFDKFKGGAVEEGIADVPEDERVKLVCKRAIKGAWEAVSGCDCTDAPLLKELKPHLKRCAAASSEVLSIETYPFYVGCMRAEMENRWWKRIGTKIAPGSATGVEHQKIDIWSVTPGALKGTYSEEDCPECHRERKVKCPTCHGEHTHWDCPDCHGEAGVLHECPECDGEGEVECPDCHGKLEIKCHDCDGKGKTECPDCHGSGKKKCRECFGDGIVQKLHLITCPVCHGTGRDSHDSHCAHCDASGKSSELFKETCPICHGKGHIDCDTCHSSGHLECKECHGVGKVQCKNCHQTGKITCPSCSGNGELKCSKCNSTGIEHCHTCGGSGTVTCPKCHGDGAFAYIWNALSEKCVKGKTVVWSDADIPNDVLPNDEYYSESDVVGVYELFAKESTKEGFDLELLDGVQPECRERIDGLFKDFTIENDLAKDSKVHTRLLKQVLSIEKVDGVAKVLIQSCDMKYACWINLANATIVKISGEGGPAHNPELFGTRMSDVVDEVLKLVRLDIDKAAILRAIAKMGSTSAMAEYSKMLKNGWTMDKTEEKFEMWRELSCLFGCVESSKVNTLEYDSQKQYKDGAYKRNFIGKEVWPWLLSHLPKLMSKCCADKKDIDSFAEEYPDTKRYLRITNIGNDELIRAIWRDPLVLKLYPFDEVRLLSPRLSDEMVKAFAENRELRNHLQPEDWVNAIPSFHEDTKGSVRKLAKKIDFSKFTNIQKVALLKPQDWKTADIEDLLDIDVGAFGMKSLVALIGTFRDESKLKDMDIEKRLERLSPDDFFIMILEARNARISLRIKDEVVLPVVLRRSKEFSTAEWTSFFESVRKHDLHRFDYEDLVDWPSITAKLSFEELVRLVDFDSNLDEHINWEKVPGLERGEFGSLTDDQRVDFAIGHEKLAPMVLKGGFDPNKIRPWCLDLSYDKWPERLATFNPDTYDWSQCTPRLWAQLLYGHPEFVKYCPAEKIDWHALDKEKIKYWKWALGALGEKVAPQFTKWDELDEERWNDILKKQPELAEYKKKYGKRS